MIYKTICIGEICTDVQLEAGVWSYLDDIANHRGIRLHGLVNEVAEATPDHTRLASSLRITAMTDARKRCDTLKQELDKLTLAGVSNDMARVLEVSPLPALILGHDRCIKLANQSFLRWLDLDPNTTIGSHLEKVMILRGSNLKELWDRLLDGRTTQGDFNVAYVVPGKVRIARALAVTLAADSTANICARNKQAVPSKGCLVLFETLAGYKRKTRRGGTFRNPNGDRLPTAPLGQMSIRI